MREHSPPDLSTLTPVFLTVHLLGGHIGLPALVATFLFSKTAKRHPTIVNLCVVWILYSITYCLLLYGGHEWQKHPPHALCLAQTAMNYGAPPMAVVASFAVVLQIWSTFRIPWKAAQLARIPQWVKLLAIILPPYLTFLGFSLSAAYYGLKNPHWVRVKNGLYCGLMHGKFEMLAGPIFCGIFVVLIIGFEVATIVRYFLGRHIIKKVFPLADRKKPSLSPWCRAALFFLYGGLTLGACVMNLSQGPNEFVYMIEATLPLAAFLIFGLQKDVIWTWLRWGHRDANTLDEPPFGETAGRGYVDRTFSFMSGTSIGPTTPVAAHLPTTVPHPSNSIV